VRQHVKGQGSMGELCSVRPDVFPTMKERKSLRLRSQVYMLFILLSTLLSTNAAVITWMFASTTMAVAGGYGAAMPCPGALMLPGTTFNGNGTSSTLPGTTFNDGDGTSSTPEGYHQCSTVDPVGISAMLIGLVLLLHTGACIYYFITAPLLLREGEDSLSKCYLNNSSDEHCKQNGVMAKGMAAAVFGFEVLVTMIPLSPYCYLLTFGPAVFGSIAQTQKCFKM